MPSSRRTPFALVALALLLAACAARQVDGNAALLDPEISARQEYVADVQLRSGRASQAVEGYDKALVARPNDVGLRIKKGQALLRLNEPEAALASFRLALAASPDSPGAHFGVGQACERLGRGEEASQAFARAVELAPESWRARCHLGVALLRLGRADQAGQQFRAALALPQVRTGDAAAREDLLNNLGVAQAMNGDTEAAVKTFRQALQGARDPERSANNLGLLLVRLGRQAEAFDAFRVGGNDARALNNLGYALYLKGQVDRARSLFEKALDLSPAYYETAGENLKRTLAGAPVNESIIESAPAPTRQSARPPARQMAKPAGQELRSSHEVAPGLARLSLTDAGEAQLRFGRASLRGETLQ